MRSYSDQKQNIATLLCLARHFEHCLYSGNASYSSHDETTTQILLQWRQLWSNISNIVHVMSKCCMACMIIMIWSWAHSCLSGRLSTCKTWYWKSQGPQGELMMKAWIRFQYTNICFDAERKQLKLSGCFSSRGRITSCGK